MNKDEHQKIEIMPPIIFRCDYCPNDSNEKSYALIPENGKEAYVCINCLIKLLNKVLGKKL